MDADGAVVAGVVVNLVADIVGHNAASPRVIVNKVIQNFVGLAGDIVGENPVSAVVVDGIVANDIVARPKGRLSSIDGELNAGQARLVTMILLDNVGAGTGDADAIAFSFSRLVGIGIGHVVGD